MKMAKLEIGGAFSFLLSLCTNLEKQARTNHEFSKMLTENFRLQTMDATIYCNLALGRRAISSHPDWLLLDCF